MHIFYHITTKYQTQTIRYFFLIKLIINICILIEAISVIDLLFFKKWKRKFNELILNYQLPSNEYLIVKPIPESILIEILHPTAQQELTFYKVIWIIKLLQLESILKVEQA